MSTRANIKIIDSSPPNDALWFCRHNDGYPEGVKDTLSKFMMWLRTEVIRDNVSQAAGWLIALGIEEKKELRKATKRMRLNSSPFKPDDDPMTGWKVGMYEPSTGRHGDIDYLYVIDVHEKTLRAYNTPTGIEAEDVEITDFVWNFR